MASYQSLFGELPPVDVFAIDIYPIDWVNTPNNDPEQPAFYPAKGKSFPHWVIAIEQLIEMRRFLELIPLYANTPIWITEIAIHVGYDGWGWDLFPTQISPVGKYHWELMSDYLVSVLDWLESNGHDYGIDKWFFFTTWKDIVNVGSDGYMGIIFFDGRNNGASLNCLGETYHARAIGGSRVRCDASGNTVPDGEPPPIPNLSILGLVVVAIAFTVLISMRLRKSAVWRQVFQEGEGAQRVGGKQKQMYTLWTDV